jgi:hypothetical protein
VPYFKPKMLLIHSSRTEGMATVFRVQHPRWRRAISVLKPVATVLLVLRVGANITYQRLGYGACEVTVCGIEHQP